MGTSEIPAGDNIQVEEPDGTTPVEKEPDEASIDTGNKTSVCQRVWIGTVITVVVAVAIIGAVVAIVPETKRKNNFKSGNNSGIASTIEAPFDVDPFLLSTDSTYPYTSIEEVQEDIEGLTMIIVNNIIENNVNGGNSYYDDDGSWMMMDMPVFASDSLMTTATAESAGAIPQIAPAVSSSKVSSSAESAFGDTNDFGTYQHEAGVVKNDLVKSNGVHVFAASSNRILVWDLEGNKKETILFKAKAHEDYDDDNMYAPLPQVQALLMNPEGTKLIVVAADAMGHYPFASDRFHDYPIVDSYNATRVIVYDIEGSTLTEVAESNINGHHVDSYMVGNNVHIVTKMTLDTWRGLKDPLSRWNIDPNHSLTDEEYVAAASRKAEEIIPKFVKQVTDFVIEDDNILLSRLIGFPGSMSDYTALTQVSSFDTSIIDNENDIALNTSKSLVLRPGNTGYVYATDAWIWVSDQTWIPSLDTQEYVEQTMLLGFRLDGASSTFAAVGSVPGSLLNQFAIDFVEDADNAKEYIRVATTQNFIRGGQWGWMPRPLTPWLEDTTEEDTESQTKNQIMIFEVPKVEGNDQKISELVELGSVEVGKKDETITAVRFFDNLSYVVTFERTDPFYVLDLSDPKDPKVLGELEIPGFSEFMHPIKEDNSMLITVGQDADDDGNIKGFQISIFNSTIPTDPKLVDRLVLENDRDSWSGSSASWDERAFRYIQVGELGRLIIPVEIYFHGWDKLGNNLGDDFGGFMVFGVDLTQTENMITRELEINHLQDFSNIPEPVGCSCGYYYYTYLPQRSMVFDGNLMTLKDEQVISTNLVTGDPMWNLTFPQYNDRGCCDGDL